MRISDHEPVSVSWVLGGMGSLHGRGIAIALQHRAKRIEHRAERMERGAGKGNQRSEVRKTAVRCQRSAIRRNSTEVRDGYE